MLKGLKPGRRYILCNIDEPYAKDVYEVIKRGQMAKGPGAWPEGDISFEEWTKLTWPVSNKERLEMLAKKIEAAEEYIASGNLKYCDSRAQVWILRNLRLNTEERDALRKVINEGGGE